MLKYNEIATILNEMQDLQNYLIEAVRDIDTLDEDTCTVAITADAYTNEIVKQLGLHRQQLNEQRVQDVLEMNISDAEKDELVEVMMKSCGFANDLELAFEKMDPNSKEHFLKFRKFVLSQAEEEEREPSQDKYNNKPDNIHQVVEKSIRDDYSGYSNQNKEVKNVNHEVFGKSAYEDSMDGLNRQLNFRNNHDPALDFNQKQNPVHISTQKQELLSSIPEKKPFDSKENSINVVKEPRKDMISSPPPIVIPKISPEKPRLLTDEDDLDFEIPGERSERRNPDPYLENNDQLYNRWDDQPPIDFRKQHVKSEFQPSRVTEDPIKFKSEFITKPGMHVDDPFSAWHNLKIPEETHENKAYSDHKSQELDNLRLDMLEDDESPGAVPVTQPYMAKKQLNPGPIFQDNGDFKRFYEENRNSKMSLIKEEVNEGGSDFSSAHKHHRDIQKESLIGVSQAMSLHGEGKDLSRKSEFYKNQNGLYEVSHDSGVPQQNVPIVTDPKFINAYQKPPSQHEVKVIDEKKHVPAIKIKDSATVVSFQRKNFRHDEEVYANSEIGFKGPSPRSLWDPSKDKESPIQSSINNIHLDPFAIKKKEELPVSVIDPQKPPTYTKEEVDKMIVDKMKPLNEGYANMLAEMTRLSAELQAKKDEVSIKQARINESSMEQKPKSTIKLIAPHQASEFTENRRIKDQLHLTAEQSRYSAKVLPDNLGQTTFEDSMSGGHSKTIQNIMAFARGTVMLKTFDPLLDYKGILHENEELLIEIELDKDLSVKEGRFFLKTKLTFTNKRPNQIAGLTPKLSDDENGTIS
jgi:hypothetical protein